jgi:16S rRNA (adenine1518-N6/adenine1519-N6)-dimethyltransferase
VGSAHAISPLPPPRKRFGQNFLVDRGAIDRIVKALAPSSADNVLEIGPGRGGLTEALLGTVPKLCAIEIDRDLVAHLRSLYPATRLSLVETDILDVSFSALAGGLPLVIAGNLPYNISKPIAMKLVLERAAIARAVLMFQREVAARLTAAVGTGAYGPLTILAGRAYRIERLFDVPPGAFHPRPQVVSTVTRWTPREGDALPESLIGPLKAVLRAAFARRRQTISKNVRAALHGDDALASELLKQAGLDGTLRAEAISPEGFVALAHLWPA